MISELEKKMLHRSELLLGDTVMQRLAETRIILFGTGGVGSWCAESLVRSGIRQLTIVDCDQVCVTNCNRQLMATPATIGQVKVEALRQRLLELNPSVQVTALNMAYNPENADSFHLEQYDYVIDAIDSLPDKADLILRATAIPTVTLFCSMGAALRIDPTKVRAKEFWKIEGDGLARALRNKFKKQKTFPRHKFLCVCSEEAPMKNLGESYTCGTNQCMCPKAKLLSGERGTDTAVYDAPGDQKLVEHEWCTKKAQINGSLAPVTAAFGMTLCSLVLQDVMKHTD